MRAQASLRLGNVRGTTPELLGSYRGSVCLLSVAPCVAFGALVWPGKRDSPPRPPLLPRNAGTAEPLRVSPPEAVAYQLELFTVATTCSKTCFFCLMSGDSSLSCPLNNSACSTIFPS